MGSITVISNAKTALHCDKRNLSMVELTLRSQPKNAGPSGHLVKIHIIVSPDNRLKAVCLDKWDPSKMVQIGVSLDPK